MARGMGAHGGPRAGERVAATQCRRPGRGPGEGLAGRRPRARRGCLAGGRCRRRGRGGPGSGRREPEPMKAILLGGGLALLFSLLGTRAAIPLFQQLGYGQEIRDDGPTSHHTKRGTPTMGGLVIIASTVLAYFLAELITQNEPSASSLLLLFLFVGMGVVGFLDDYIKVSKQRSLGLRSKAKMVGQTVIALVFGWLALSHTLEDGRHVAPASHNLSFIRDLDFALPTLVAMLLIWVMITGTSNAVNLTDGLDGLATGACAMVFGAYMLVNIWQNNQSCATRPGPACYEVRDPLDLALVAAAITGACFG